MTLLKVTCGKIKKQTLNLQRKSKNNADKKNVEIIGDSILNGLVEKGLSKDGNSVKVRNYPGSTSRDLKHFAMPSIEKKPSVLIIHSGSNDLTKHVDDTIENLQFIINKSIKESPHTKIAISGLTVRKDKKNIENKVHDKFDSSCLGQKLLHANVKGNRILANDYINYLRSIT